MKTSLSLNTLTGIMALSLTLAACSKDPAAEAMARPKPPAAAAVDDVPNHNIVDIHRFRPDILHIYHKTVYSLIQRDLPGWPDMLPPEVARIIQERGLFGHRNSTEKEC